MASANIKPDPEWAAALSNYWNNEAEKVPPDFCTIEETATKLGRSVFYTKHLIRQLIKGGVIEHREFKVRWGAGCRSRPHYRLIPRAHGHKTLKAVAKGR